MLVNQILFIVFGIFLDRQQFIPLPAPKFEFIRVINYCWWTFLALYTLIFETDYFTNCYFISNTVVGSYIYEMIYHSPDKSHMVHHILTICAILYSYLAGCDLLEWWAQVTLITYVAFTSSIFSSIRKLEMFKTYKALTSKIYKASYVLSKFTALILHYWILFNNWNRHYTAMQNIAFSIFAAVHLVQLYFIFVILKS